MVSVSMVHAVPVLISRPINEPLQFSAAKSRPAKKKRTKVNHRESLRVVKLGAWMAHQVQHAADRTHSDSIMGDTEFIPFDPKDTKKGLRKEHEENSSQWSTSMDSDKVFEKDIEEDQQKAEDEWKESLNQSRSSSMINLVPANF